MVSEIGWRKSSYSGGQGGNCIEVADHDSRVIVRDTKHRLGPILRFTAEAWRRFADQVKADASLASSSPAQRALAVSGRPLLLSVRICEPPCRHGRGDRATAPPPGYR